MASVSTSSRPDPAEEGPGSVDEERRARSAKLSSVRTLWLHTKEKKSESEGPSNKVEERGAEGLSGKNLTDCPESFMLLEDLDTGDVLMPLVYMKNVFAANYSRKLSSLKHRLVMVTKPDEQKGSPGSSTHNTASSKDFMYWVWAFESPHEVKVLARQTLGDENAPQGHLRLILLPIVYSAMALKKELRETPFFRALHRALSLSTYATLFELLPTSAQTNCTTARDPTMETSELMAEVPAEGLSGPPTSMTETRSDEDGLIFHGPYDLQRTLAKYTLSYEGVEDTDHNISKRQRRAYKGSSRSIPSLSSHPGVLGSPPPQPPSASQSTGRMAPNTPGRGAPDADPTPSQVNVGDKVNGGNVDIQLAALRDQVEAAHYEVKAFRNEYSAQLLSVQHQLQGLQSCIQEAHPAIAARFLTLQIQPSSIPRHLQLPHATLGDGSERGVPSPHDGMPPSFHPLPQPPAIHSQVNGSQYGDSIAAMMQHFEGQARTTLEEGNHQHQHQHHHAPISSYHPNPINNQHKPNDFKTPRQTIFSQNSREVPPFTFSNGQPGIPHGYQLVPIPSQDVSNTHEIDRIEHHGRPHNSPSITPSIEGSSPTSSNPSFGPSLASALGHDNDGNLAQGFRPPSSAPGSTKPGGTLQQPKVLRWDEVYHARNGVWKWRNDPQEAPQNQNQNQNQNQGKLPPSPPQQNGDQVPFIDHEMSPWSRQAYMSTGPAAQPSSPLRNVTLGPRYEVPMMQLAPKIPQPQPGAHGLPHGRSECSGETSSSGGLLRFQRHLEIDQEQAALKSLEAMAVAHARRTSGGGQRMGGVGGRESVYLQGYE